MPKGNPHPSNGFKKGQSGNPSGLPKGVIPKKVIKEFTAKTVSDAYAKICQYTKKELEYAIEGGSLIAIEHIVARCLLWDMKNSTTTNLRSLLERIIGPVPIMTKAEYSGPGGTPIQMGLPNVSINLTEAVAPAIPDSEKKAVVAAPASE